jgi:tripartite-type tricarboxylate transporter receptor subunit TctC
MTHIPYKGGLAAMPDLIAGRVPVLFANIGLAVPHIHSDKVAVLATTGTAKSRFPLLPGVPTLAEAADLKGYETYDWFGILAPAGTPQPIVMQLNRSVTQLLENPEVKKKLADQGAQIESRTPAEFGEFIKSEIAKWAEVIRFSGAKLD